MPPVVDKQDEPSATRHQARLRRIRLLSHLLDAQFRLPGTRYRLGLDGLLGLIPGVGDILGTCLSVYIVYEASRLGAPRALLLRMLANLGLDTLVGAVPVAGDIFDIAWKANQKNVALLETYLASHQGV
jgi:hypothetical protein